MTNKKKPHTAGTGPASKRAINGRHFTSSDPLLGWLDLAKPSRNRQQKQNWKRGQR